MKRPPAFDPARDPSVGTEALKVAARLAAYYDGEGQSDPVLIHLPPAAFAPAFSWRVPFLARNKWVAAVALVTICAIGAFAWFNWSSQGTRRRWTVAVLPFRNATGVADDDVICRAFTSDLAKRIARIPATTVLAPGTSAVLAKELRGWPALPVRLDAYVQGSLRREGAQIHVSAALVQASDGRALWSETTTAEGRQAADIERKIGQAIFASLGSRNADHQGDQWGMEAFGVGGVGRYWKGRELEEHGDARSYPGSIDLYEQAIAENPSFAPAWSALAQLYALTAIRQAAANQGTVAKVEHAADMALLLAPESEEALTALGIAAAFFDHDWASGESKFDRAVRSNPSYAEAHEWYALSLAARNKAGQAMEHSAAARDLDPLSVEGANRRAMVAYYARDFEQAERLGRQALSADANDWGSRLVLGMCARAKGRFADAIEHLQAAASRSEQSARVLGRLGNALAGAGKPGDARQILAQLESRSAKEAVQVPLAFVYLGLGDTASAEGRLKEAVQRSEVDADFIAAEPLCDALRTSATYWTLVKRLGLPDY